MTSAEAAGVIELPGRTQIELTGADRQSFLHNLCTNDIRRLSPGDGCEAMLLDAKGHVQFYVHVFAGAGSLVIETAAGEAERLLAHLERYHIREKVEIADRTTEWGELYLGGICPGETFSVADADFSYGSKQSFSTTIAAAIVRAHPVAFDSSPGFLLRAPIQDLPRLKAAFLAAGARDVKQSAFELMRMLGRFPGPAELGDKTLPQELDRDERAISFVKGCYLGQETVARIDALGHVNRLLRTVEFGAGEVSAGMPLFREKQEVGRITSVYRFPDGDATFALAFVRRPFCDGGTLFDSEGGQASIRVPLPPISA